MKKYIRQRIENIGVKWTNDQKNEMIRSMYEILTERGYSLAKAGELIAKTINDRMKELKSLADKNICYFEEEIKRREDEV